MTERYLVRIFILTGLIGIVLLGYMHEQVHVSIFDSYGIKSHIEYFSHFPNMITIPEKPCPNEECILANNINDVVGYHLVVFYYLLLIGFLILIEKE